MYIITSENRSIKKIIAKNKNIAEEINKNNDEEILETKDKSQFSIQLKLSK